MRILQIIHSLRRGGAERVAVDLAKGLAARHHQVRLCTLVPVNDFSGELAGDPPVSAVSLLRSAPRCFFAYLPLLLVRLRKLIASFKPDVVHCHLRTDSGLCAFVGDTPVVRTLHTSEPLWAHHKVPLSYWPINLMERRSLSRPNVTIAACSRVSAAAMEPYLARRGRPPPVVVRNGISLGRIVPLERYAPRGNAFHIAMVGVLEPYFKNQRMALRCLKILLDRGLDGRLSFLGDGPDRGPLAVLARTLGIEDRVSFRGECADVPGALSQSDLYWVTSRNEGLPISLLEAMATGLPVVACRAGGVTDALEPWPEMTAEPDDDASFAAISERLMNSRDLRESFGRALRTRAVDGFSGDRMVTEYLGLYEHVLRRAGKP